MKLSTAIITGLFIGGISLGACALAENVWVFFGITAITGLSIPLVNIGIGGWLPKIVDPKMMGRVQGWITPINMLSHTLTLALIALFFPQFITVEAIFYVIGGSLVIVGIFYMMTLPKYEKEESVTEIEPQKITG
jgi:hypothetical protein